MSDTQPISQGHGGENAPLRDRVADAIHAQAEQMPALAMHRTEALRLADVALAVVGVDQTPVDEAPNVPLHAWTVFVPPIERCANCRVKPAQADSWECPGPFDTNHQPPMSRDFGTFEFASPREAEAARLGRTPE